MNEQLFYYLRRYSYMIKSVLLAIAAIFILSVQLKAQDNWELRRDEEGIKIYSRRPSGGKLIELRLLTQYQATP